MIQVGFPPRTSEFAPHSLYQLSFWGNWPTCATPITQIAPPLTERQTYVVSLTITQDLWKGDKLSQFHHLIELRSKLDKKQGLDNKSRWFAWMKISRFQTHDHGAFYKKTQKTILFISISIFCGFPLIRRCWEFIKSSNWLTWISLRNGSLVTPRVKGESDFALLGQFWKIKSRKS